MFTSSAIVPADVSSIPRNTRNGSYIERTNAEFLRATYIRLVTSVLITDFVATIFRHDPYYSLGPTYNTALPDNQPVPLPPTLASLSPPTLHFVRGVAFLILVQQSLASCLTMHDLVQYYIFGHFSPIRREPWWHPTQWGSPMAVADRGYAGFWGTWWHQSFRNIFTAPTDYLIQLGVLSGPRSKGAQRTNLFFPFFVSAVLHAAASHMAPGPTRAWQPFAFFASASFGVAMQDGVCGVLDRYCGDKDEGLDPKRPDGPRWQRPIWLRRTVNLLYVALWLLISYRPLMEDMASSGFLQYEPSPVSFARILGLGRRGDEQILRGSHWPWWHHGEHWWESGLAV